MDMNSIVLTAMILKILECGGGMNIHEGRVTSAD
jgi:hypothetical protein